ncbi:MAG TPA: glucokinase [Anaerolineae bacterium]|nr:glucokinase [Anaerolineae bacterium]
MSNGNRLLLAGDIGGTKTTLALFTPEAGPRHPLAQATFPSGEHGSLENIVAQFLTGKNVRVTEASFGVAGPVVQGRAQVTNLPWGADEHSLSRALDGAPVRLLNDLDAIAHKGRFAGMLARVPLHVILNPQVALLGAACHGLEPEMAHD